MALDVPTLEQFLERFPEFEGQDEKITALIAEAQNSVDERWRTQDQRTAIQYLVAHMLQVENEQIEGGAIASESFGGAISVSYARNTSVTVLGTTVYGQRYLALARANVGGPRVVTQSNLNGV